MLDPKIINNIKKYLSFLEVDKEEKLIITSTYPLSNEEKEEVKKFFPKQVTVENKVDPRIIGGLIIEYGSKIIDLSLKGKISSFGKEEKKRKKIGL